MYNVLIEKKVDISTSIPKWRDKGYIFSQTDWNKIFELPFKSIKESKLQWLQFQILHRIIPTNDYLYKLKKANSPICSFCKIEIENIDHLFFKCPLVNDLWCSIEKWILSMFEMHISFDIQSVLFGKYKNRNLFRFNNLVILTVKQCKNNAYLIL